MKFKKLTKEQIIISIDRLTRFKPTGEKYLRVFSEIISSNLIEPKIKKSQIESLDAKIIKNYVTEIFNASFDFPPIDFSINKKLIEYENSVFENNSFTNELLDNELNYLGAIELLGGNLPHNLVWLKNLNNPEDIIVTRKTLACRFPLEKIVLAEGITEEVLLPEFAKFLGYDFDKYGVQIISAGGKNQVVKAFYELYSISKLPIFVLLDRDGEDNINQIMPKLRKQDKIHLVKCGEFEDLLSRSLIVKTVNSDFKNFLAITEADLEKEESTAKILEELFKTKGTHEFKKAEFSKLIKQNISEDSDISNEIRDIIIEIKNC